ncbi:Transcriptional repressor SdpR [Pirellula sp. SH-Sr6A]|uniref:ArsR/SmtB family transcription factor n=1 Tax=Pirellula sp. SH-Sr6A TaxID=1632865 RepID=UPI00078D5DC5|nr:metalloregulator ArsR/SmtB family transcription factor [Pirellula sp. SH-Sr6A]AMV32314.1 Transcriptional repressor SdpR [Pirellula sp. SH-Sr6A]
MTTSKNRGKESTSKSDDSEQCAKYLKALADPARIRILKALQGSPLTGTDLSNLLDIEIPNVSHHLRVLYHAGIVHTRREGRFIYYEINREVLASRTVAQTLDFGCCTLRMSGEE